MSLVGNIFWKLFDTQSANRTHHEARTEDLRLAKDEVKTAGKLLASPFTILRDAWAGQADKEKASGWKKFGWGLATALATPFLVARGVVGGTIYGLLALKNGVIDPVAHGVAHLFEGRHQPQPPVTPPVDGGGSKPPRIIIRKPQG